MQNLGGQTKSIMVFFEVAYSFKEVSSYQEEKKDFRMQLARKTKVSLLCCFRLKNMVHFPLTSATCTAYANNSETHLTNRNKPIRHPVC